MKNFNKKLTLIVALASIISSSASAGIWPQRGVLFMGKSFLGSVKDGVLDACDAVQYNVRDLLGLVSPIEQAKREVNLVGLEFKNAAIDAGIDAIAELANGFLPEHLRGKINTKQLVIAAGALGIVGACAAGTAIHNRAQKAGSAIKDGANKFGQAVQIGANNAGAAMKNGARGMYRWMTPVHVGPDRADLARFAQEKIAAKNAQASGKN